MESKYDKNEVIYETEADSQTQRTDLWLPGGWGGGRMEWEFGVSRCKLLYIELINNKVLLYSTGNYIQYPVINHNEKEYKKQIPYANTYIWNLKKKKKVVMNLGAGRE